jgi:SNF2 family DNA or RNA helicase
MYKGTLLDFQIEGAQFMANKRRAICAYEVGLGKTHVTMAVIEKLREYDRLHNTLVVAPSYLKWKWADELLEWTDTPFFIVDGTAAQRKAKYDEIAACGVQDYYAVISYESLLRDRDIISSIPFDGMVLDEVTKIKNFRTKTARCIKRFTPKYRYGLTGTPIGNKAEELFSIMQWIDKALFGTWPHFENDYIVRGHFGEIRCYKNLQHLAKLAGQRMIAKLQEEVSEQLPKVRVIPMKIDFTPAQARLYNKIAASLEEFLDMYVDNLLDDNSHGADIASMLARQRFSALRQACISPKMLANSATRYAKSLNVDKLESYDEVGPKIAAVQDLILEAVVDSSDKMIVFSFFLQPLEYLEEFLKEHNIGYLKLVGGMSSSAAHDLQQRFQKDPDILVFLTSDAGQKGLDLQQAKYLVNIDIPFSWENYDQRLGRFKRIGSPHTHVYVYDFMMKDSMEERFYQNLDAKGRLLRAVTGKSAEDMVVPVEMSLREYLKTRKV